MSTIALPDWFQGNVQMTCMIRICTLYQFTQIPSNMHETAIDIFEFVLFSFTRKLFINLTNFI
jgi:hypothetical protein